jgi:hypothetical protein
VAAGEGFEMIAELKRWIQQHFARGGDPRVVLNRLGVDMASNPELDFKEDEELWHLAQQLVNDIMRSMFVR